MFWSHLISYLMYMVCLGAILLLPPLWQTLPQLSSTQAYHLIGAFHVHSNHSHDASSTIGDIAKSASQLGIDFVIVSDHGQAPFVVHRVEGVTMLGISEQSLAVGHQLNLTPKPIVAHPSDSKRPWRGDYNKMGGIEIANAAASARRRIGPAGLNYLTSVLSLPLNPHLAILQLLDRDSEALTIWDQHAAPGFLGLCGSDSHGWLPLTWLLPSWLLVLENTEVNALDPTQILEEITAGRFFCTAGLLGMRPDFSWQTQTLLGKQTEHVEVSVHAPQFPSSTIIVRSPSEIVAQNNGPRLTYVGLRGDLVRVEVWLQLPSAFHLEDWISGRPRSMPVIYSQWRRL